MIKYYLHIILLFALACSTDVEPSVDCAVNGVTLELLEVGDADCGVQNGFIKVSATGGTGNYQFKLHSGSFQPTGEFQGLESGSYVITLRDENTCEQTLSVNVLNKDGVNLLLAGTAAGCNSADGTITAQPVGGEAPFLFKLDNASFQAESVFANLSRGNHAVTIKDNTGCEVSQTINVLSGVSFDATINPIIQTSCAINNCHNGRQFPDFRQFNNIKANAAKIKELTGNRSMPQEGMLTQGQIDAIACWVDDGAIDN